MIHPVPKIGVHPRTPIISYSHKLITIIFKILHLTLALDFGFFTFQRSKPRFFAKLCTFIHCLLICATITYFQNVKRFDFLIMDSLYVFLYAVCTVLLLKFKKGTTFNDFLATIRKIDLRMGVNTSVCNIEIAVVLGVIGVFWYRSGLIILYCCNTNHLCNNPCWLGPIYYSHVAAIDVAMITYTCIMYTINSRLSKLATVLKEGDKRRTRSYISLQLIYKYIADVTEKFKQAYDGMMFFAILFHVPEAMTTIYLSYLELQHLQNNMPMQSVFFFVHHFLDVKSLVLTLAPAIYAGMLTTLSEKIRITLHHKLLIEKEGIRRAQIVQFIKYAEARPLALSVYTLIPLNAHLISIVINFCVTYLIVIIQFTSNKP